MKVAVAGRLRVFEDSRQLKGILPTRSNQKKLKISSPQLSSKSRRELVENKRQLTETAITTGDIAVAWS